MMKILNKLLFVFSMAFAASATYATNCGIGTTFQRGSDGVARCVGAVPVSDIKPPQQQAQAQTVGVSTASSVGVSSSLSNGVSANLNSPIVQESNQSSMYVLPAPASAAALPAGFCTDGRSSQLSILGIGYGSSRSSFDTVNYKRCIEVAKAMRQQSPQELAMAHCASAADVPVCVSQLIAAMSPPAFNLIAEPVDASETVVEADDPQVCPVRQANHKTKLKKKRVNGLNSSTAVCK